MKRILIGFGILLLLGACATWSATRPPPPMTPSATLTIGGGQITGGLSNKNSDISVFNGLPFAAPPVGDLRWAPPLKPVNWQGIRDVRDFGPECIQPRASSGAYFRGIVNGIGLPWYKRKLATLSLRNSGAPNESEDCLTLNVRTGNLGANATPQPVMVWLHGGSHQFGSGSSELYQANGLVENGVVLVTINYRLGPFGYLAHPALTAASPHASSGNYGLMDQMAALHWVRDNITVFGGDPDNVTVFGESAGAQSITEMMASPMARGLFHKAIMESGSSSYNSIHLDTAVEGRKSAHEAGMDFVETIIPAGVDATATSLRDIPAEAIIARVEAKPHLANYFLPNVDGWIIPQMIGASMVDGNSIHVPILAGYNSDEGTLFYPGLQSPTFIVAPFPKEQEERMETLSFVYGEMDAITLAENYGLEREGNWDAGATAILGDEYFGMQMRLLGRTNSEAGEPTWLYYFSRKPPSRKQTIGAFHASEISFVFNSHSRFLKFSDEDLALTEAMGLYWTNFAKTGDPNGDSLITWPGFDRDGDNWLNLDRAIKPVSNLHSVNLNIFERLLLSRLEGARKLLEVPIASEETGEADSVATAP